MRFLLLGGSGQLGEELRALAAYRDIDVVAPSRQSLDLGDASAIARKIAAGRGAATSRHARATSRAAVGRPRGAATRVRRSRSRVRIYHYAGGVEATWFDFARMIVEMAKDSSLRSPELYQFSLPNTRRQHIPGSIARR
jgi:dTDP-4-dehydrorhamnose reductase